jgi:hypothetical protein
MPHLWNIVEIDALAYFFNESLQGMVYNGQVCWFFMLSFTAKMPIKK